MFHHIDMENRGHYKQAQTLPHRIHVWYIYLHAVDSYGQLVVGKYTLRPMDHMGNIQVLGNNWETTATRRAPNPVLSGVMGHIYNC